MNRERIIEALRALPSVTYDAEWDLYYPLSPGEAITIAPTVEALIAEAVDEALEAAAVDVEADLHDDCEHEDCQAERDIYRHAASIARSRKTSQKTNAENSAGN